MTIITQGTRSLIQQQVEDINACRVRMTNGSQPLPLLDETIQSWSSGIANLSRYVQFILLVFTRQVTVL